MARSSSSTPAGGAAADHTFRDQGEEAFHLIEPRTAGGGEVEIEVKVLSGFEPPLYGGALVCAVVVQNDVHLQIGRVCFAKTLAGTNSGAVRCGSGLDMFNC